MPDAKAGSFAVIDGNEVINTQRTIAYIRNFGLPIHVDPDCWCPNLNDLLGDCPAPTGGPNDPVYAPAGYQFPSNNPGFDTSVKSDPAPWYDPAIPESGDFLGFLPTSFEGLGSTFTRSNTPTLTGGSILGRLVPQERILTWRGYLFGRTCCAAEYGLRWLTSVFQFAGGCDGCNGSELNILLCCPDVSGTPNPLACGGSASDPMNIIPDIGQMKSADAFRTFYRVGLADGPRYLSERTLGCGTCEDEGGGCIIEAEFSLVAGNPFMFKDAISIPCVGTFPPCGTCPGEAEEGFWIKTPTTSYPASEEDAKGCTALLECLSEPDDCINDPSCPTATLPEIPGFEDPCGCTPYNVTEFCCKIDNDLYGQFFEAIPKITVFSGDEDLHNVGIKFYENPQERDCDDEDMFDICNLCDEINIRYIPKNSTLTLDGLTRTIDIECPGGNINSAESLVTTTFRWPTLKCIGYIIKVSADCNWPVADNTRVEICIYPREM